MTDCNCQYGDIEDKSITTPLCLFRADDASFRNSSSTQDHDDSSVEEDEERHRKYLTQEAKWSDVIQDARQHISHREAHIEYSTELTQAISRYQVNVFARAQKMAP